ncbi:hypothetical protein DEVEQU_01116 [Devosia equisanguinis]|uniref:DUF4214 domain-containing protein n=1 Tax=Devosia equisanguinis TaxID=2490941 RepID=A0A3S4DP74_9HYPH|nr:DUF4214 domain-containing protein [Devosia equisanguinis]VDS03987.1 hypothetical protein DEVEQU_01116 [Devosia equisanguinis]
MALTTAQLITQLYVGYYNRAPDPEGLNYWIGRVNAGVSLADIADSFAASPEALAAYPYLALPNVASAQNFLNQVYQNLFNRAPDAEGLAYYAGKLASGATTPGQIIAEIQANANTNPNNTDGQVLANKVAVASNWVDQAANTPSFEFNAAAKSSAGSVLANVDASDASVVAANAKVDTFFDNVVTGDTFETTVGIDNFIGTSANDLFKVIATNNVSGADATTWNSSDSFDGAGGRDTLNVEVKTGFNQTLYSTSNIETINIDNTVAASAAGHAGAGSAVDASKFAGVEVVNQIGKASAVTKLADTSTAGFKNIDTSGTLSVTAADAAASVAVNLDGVKDATDNVVNLSVGGKAVSSVIVSGAVANASVAGAAGATETFTATFTAAGADGDTVTFDGRVYTVASAPLANADAQAAAFVTAYNGAAANWTATAGPGGVVTFVSKSANTSVPDVTAANFAVTGAVAAPVVAITQQGVAVPDQSLALAVAAGKDVETISVNSAVTTTLTFTQDGASTKNVTAIEAAASTGAVTFTTAGTNVKTVTTGSGADKVTINTVTSATVSALVNTGAGNDEITVQTTGTGTTTINAGAGDDKIIFTGTLNTRTSIDGGEGVDTLSLAGKSLIAEDYVLFNNAIKNVEQVEFTGNSDAVVDASKLAFTAYTFAGNAGDKITEASAVAVTTKASIEAYATGYKADGADAGTEADAQGGNLNLTSTGSGSVKAFGADLTLNVNASNTAPTAVVLSGDVLTANIVLKSGGNAANDDQLASVSITTADVAVSPVVGNAYLNSVTLSGNGSATIDNTLGSKLTTVDASGLTNVQSFGANAGEIGNGLTYTGKADLVESITLGAGKDTVNIRSTYDKLDTIIGFDAVKETNDAKSTTDVLNFNGVALNGLVANQAVKVALTASATTLDLAFVEAAATGAGTKFFQFEGNTYLFSNATANNVLDANDHAAKIVGLVDFSATWGVFTA